MLVNALGKNNYELFKQKNFLNPSKTLDSNEELEDTLVSDPVFKSLLNKDREIEVEGTIFKITPHGTFAFLPEKRLKVEEIIMSLDAGKTIKQQKLSEYFYQIDTGVVRYDTFKEMADNTIDITSEIQEKNDTYSKSSENEDIATHYIKKKHTIVGSALQNKFGFNKTVRRELSSRRRIKVSFSCPNYLVLTYVTASITYQKKNWIGWSKTSAEKLAFGWDGLVVSLNGAPAFNVTAPRTSERIGEVTPPFSNKTYIGLYLPSFRLYFTDQWYFTIPSSSVTFTRKDLHNAFKAGFDYLKRNYGTATVSQIVVFPNLNEMIVGPEERVRTNAGHMSETFNWAIGGGFKWNLSSPIGLSNFSISPLSLTVSKASIYGKVDDGGTKNFGVRITKDW